LTFASDDRCGIAHRPTLFGKKTLFAGRIKTRLRYATARQVDPDKKGVFMRRLGWRRFSTEIFSSRTGLDWFDGTVPSHEWLGYFQGARTKSETGKMLLCRNLS
jgi:hypothetical protein